MQASIVLQPSLTDDSHSRIHFTNWKKSLATAAQGMCRTLDDCGVYSQVVNDQEWNSHPTNIIHTTSLSGVITTTVRARPTFIKPTIYAATEKSTAVINLFKYRELQWKEWTAASMALHQAMINKGCTVRASLGCRSVDGEREDRTLDREAVMCPRAVAGE
jgi:hypothetical protein